MNWWKRRRLRIAREKYAYWKARREAMERLGDCFCIVNQVKYQTSCGQTAKYEDRVESLMREK